MPHGQCLLLPAANQPYPELRIWLVSPPRSARAQSTRNATCPVLPFILWENMHADTDGGAIAVLDEYTILAPDVSSRLAGLAGAVPCLTPAPPAPPSPAPPSPEALQQPRESTGRRRLQQQAPAGSGTGSTGGSSTAGGSGSSTGGATGISGSSSSAVSRPPDTLLAFDSTFAANQARGGGGGAVFGSLATLSITITRCNFTGNDASSGGGGAVALRRMAVPADSKAPPTQVGLTTLTGCVFRGNSVSNGKRCGMGEHVWWWATGV